MIFLLNKHFDSKLSYTLHSYFVTPVCQSVCHIKRFIENWFFTLKSQQKPSKISVNDEFAKKYNSCLFPVNSQEDDFRTFKKCLYQKYWYKEAFISRFIMKHWILMTYICIVKEQVQIITIY